MVAADEAYAAYAKDRQVVTRLLDEVQYTARALSVVYQVYYNY
jgi:hypothetical protein